MKASLIHNLSKLHITLDRLAEQILPQEFFKSFKTIPLKSKLVGMAFFAHIADNTELRDGCMDILRQMDVVEAKQESGEVVAWNS